MTEIDLRATDTKVAEYMDKSAATFPTTITKIVTWGEN
jgi:hypothetical protein